MFQLDQRSSKIISATTRIEFHGDERVPASDIKIQVDVSAKELDTISRGLCESLYRMPTTGDQIALISPESAERAYTALRHPGLEPLQLKQKFPGYELELGVLEDGEGEEPEFIQKAFFAAAEVKNFKILAREGGTATVEFTISCSDVDEDDYLEIRRLLIDGEAGVTLVAPKAQSQQTTTEEDGGGEAEQQAAKDEAQRLVEKGKEAA